MLIHQKYKIKKFQHLICPQGIWIIHSEQGRGGELENHNHHSDLKCEKVLIYPCQLTLVQYAEANDPHGQGFIELRITEEPKRG